MRVTDGGVVRRYTEQVTLRATVADRKRASNIEVSTDDPKYFTIHWLWPMSEILGVTETTAANGARFESRTDAVREEERLIDRHLHELSERVSRPG